MKDVMYICMRHAFENVLNGDVSIYSYLHNIDQVDHNSTTKNRKVPLPRELKLRAIIHCIYV